MVKRNLFLTFFSTIIIIGAVMTAISYSTRLDSPVLIHVPIIKQKPELYNGCEVTTLAMLLNWTGVAVDKMDLAKEIQKDNTELTKDLDGMIVSWGDPNEGFVGDITGLEIGYGVYHKSIASLLNEYMPEISVDLTGTSFKKILNHVKKGKPVAVWCTSFFKPTEDWVTWEGPNGPVTATFDEHCVLLVGFDLTKQVVYINDPLDGSRGKPIPLEDFKNSWEQLGSQAVSIK